jgi:hypothetical protein
MWDLDSSEFMKVFFILSVASLTETEVIACVAVKPKLASFYRLLAAVACKPSLKLTGGLLSFNLLVNLLLNRF